MIYTACHKFKIVYKYNFPELKTLSSVIRNQITHAMSKTGRDGNGVKYRDADKMALSRLKCGHRARRSTT